MPLCPSCQAANEPTAESCIGCGKSLYALTRGGVLSGRYEVLDILGKGGMGMVYKARDRELNETVALKVLRSDLAGTEEMATRFRTEIKLARKVSHPGVCRIHDYGREGHLTYIVMEFLEGTDLKQELKALGALPPDQAFDVAIQIAEGVDAVHRVGIVHRDLKTSNVMKTAGGAVKLMDFGIAKSFGSDATAGATASGHVVGTPEYMSPEQAKAETIDVRSDVYALGIVIFELFTGDVPFRGDTPLNTLLKHLQDPPPLEGPSALRLPPPLVPVLRKALAKTAAERQATVRELIKDLEQVRAQTAAPIPPPPPRATGPAPTIAPRPPAAPVSPPRAAPSSQGRGVPKWMVLGGAGAVVLAVAVAAGAVWLYSRSGEKPSEALPSLSAAETASAGSDADAADAPAVQAAAREALSRARVLDVDGRILDIVGITRGVEGLLKDLGARVTGQEIVIELQADVLFDFDKADLKPGAEASLGKVAEVVNAQRGPVTVDGHTDGKGAEAYNRKLSESRAATVKDWLVRKGSVAPARISTRGLGSSRPVAANTKPDGSDDPQARQRNRRVEITIRKAP